MTYLIDRLAQLRRHLDHLRTRAPTVRSAAQLERDFSLRNDVLFSLLMTSQLVIDIAGELSARASIPFADYTEAVRNLRDITELDDAVISTLERLPGFRNVVIHEYVGLDLDLVVAALHDLDPVDTLLRTVADSMTPD